MDTLPNVGRDLIRIHKVISRALNVSLQHSQGTDLPENYRQGFNNYVRSLAILLHSHHSSEDEIAFPFWKTHHPSGPFDKLIEQHHQMSLFVEQVKQWVESGPNAFQVNTLAELHRTLSGLHDLWEVHIALEEDTIGPEKSGQYLSPSENEQLGRQMTEHGQALSQPGELVMPFIVYNLSGSDREEFLGLLPPVLSGQLIPFTWKATWESMTPFLLVG